MKDNLHEFGKFISTCASIAKHRLYEKETLDDETKKH